MKDDLTDKQRQLVDTIVATGCSIKEAAEKAGNRPVFLTHGLEDARVSLEHSERFRDSMIENGGNVTTWFVEDRAHVDAIWGESTEYQMNLTQFFSVLS